MQLDSTTMDIYNILETMLIFVLLKENKRP